LKIVDCRLTIEGKTSVVSCPFKELPIVDWKSLAGKLIDGWKTDIRKLFFNRQSAILNRQSVACH